MVQFASYLRRVLRLIFPRINGPIDSKRNRDDSLIDHGTYGHECQLDDVDFCLFRPQ